MTDTPAPSRVVFGGEMYIRFWAIPPRDFLFLTLRYPGAATNTTQKCGHEGLCRTGLQGV